jgi:hypothetical protein
VTLPFIGDSSLSVLLLCPDDLRSKRPDAGFLDCTRVGRVILRAGNAADLPTIRDRRLPAGTEAKTVHKSLNHLAHPILPVLGRAAKAAVVAIAASFVYVVGWTASVRSDFDPSIVVLAAPLCVLVGSTVSALGFRLADVRRPLVGGAYVGVLLVVYAAAFSGLHGVETLTWAVWPAIAAHLAVIYAIQQGGGARRAHPVRATYRR